MSFHSENSITANTSENQPKGKFLNPISFICFLLKIYSLNELLVFLKIKSVVFQP